MPEGSESPPPEMQSGKQLHDPPADGQGIEKTENKGGEMKTQVENLPSNPKNPMEDALKEKFSK